MDIIGYLGFILCNIFLHGKMQHKQFMLILKDFNFKSGVSVKALLTLQRGMWTQQAG